MITGVTGKTLITGGTGFVGRSLCDQMAAEGPSSLVSVSSRNVQSLAGFGHLVWDMTEPARFPCDFQNIIHCASPTSAPLTAQSPISVFDQIVRGAENLVRFIEGASVPPRVLFLSSGAVYGGAFTPARPVKESSRRAIDLSAANAAYGEGKRVAEFLLGEAASRGVCELIVARLFSFCGTRLPVDKHFAIGNFVRDAVNTDCVTVRSDGSAIRSYMDQRDMARWLLKALDFGPSSSPFHIGSSSPISISELAKLVGRRSEEVLSKRVRVDVVGKSVGYDGFDFYVPDTTWTESVLDVNMEIGLAESIDDMLLSLASIPREI